MLPLPPNPDDATAAISEGSEYPAVAAMDVGPAECPKNVAAAAMADIVDCGW